MLLWDVKCYDYDFSYENLLSVIREAGAYSKEMVDHPHFRKVTEAFWCDNDWGDDDQAYTLWQWAIESCRSSLTDCDCYRTLWAGDEFDVEYEFMGRSGGWLTMTKFEGLTLDAKHMEDHLAELKAGEGSSEDKDRLRNLYQLVVQNDHDFRPEAVTNELEYQAAWAFFVNACSDLDLVDPVTRNRKFAAKYMQTRRRRLCRIPTGIELQSAITKPRRRIQFIHESNHS